jgi:hypothetical protein
MKQAFVYVCGSRKKVASKGPLDSNTRTVIPGTKSETGSLVQKRPRSFTWKAL